MALSTVRAKIGLGYFTPAITLGCRSDQTSLAGEAIRMSLALLGRGSNPYTAVKSLFDVIGSSDRRLSTRGSARIATIYFLFSIFIVLISVAKTNLSPTL